MVMYDINIRNWENNWCSSGHLAVKVFFLPLLNNPSPRFWLAHKVPQVVIGDNDPSCLLSQMKQEPMKKVKDDVRLRERTWGLHKLCVESMGMHKDFPILPTYSWNDHKWSLKHLFLLFMISTSYYFHIHIGIQTHWLHLTVLKKNRKIYDTHCK